MQNNAMHEKQDKTEKKNHTKETDNNHKWKKRVEGKSVIVVDGASNNNKTKYYTKNIMNAIKLKNNQQQKKSK